MSVELSFRETKSVSIVSIAGKLTLGEGVGALRHKLSAMAREGHKNILLDLGGLSHLDSSGIGVLVSSYASISNLGGKLKLLNVTSRVKDLLLLTKLYTVFEVFDDEAAAIRSYSGAPIASGE